MEFSDLNWFDITILTIILLSSIFAFLKGFIKTIFSFITWAGALAITFFSYPGAYAYLSGFMDNPRIAMAFASLGIFIISFVILAIIDGQATELFDRYRWGVMDRTLGLAFGFLRGFVIVLLLFFSMRMTIVALHLDEDSGTPGWVTEFQQASIYHILDSSMEYSSRFMPQTIRKYINETVTGAKDVVESVTEGNSPGVPGKELSSRDKQLMKKVILALPEDKVKGLYAQYENNMNGISDQENMAILAKIFEEYKVAVQNKEIKESKLLSVIEVETLNRAFSAMPPEDGESYTDKNVKQLDRLIDTAQ